MGILSGLADRAVLVAAFIGGATVPSFVAQYRQRLGGALEQARRDLAPFQQIADRTFGGDIGSLVEHHRRSTDTVFRGEAEAINLLSYSVKRLSDAVAGMTGDLYAQLLYLVKSGDVDMLRATWYQFEPALAFTPQSLLAGLSIGVAVWLVFMLLMHSLLALLRTDLPPLRFGYRREDDTPKSNVRSMRDSRPARAMR